MKVAVCFSGLPRFIPEAYPAWKKSLLEPYACDVFVHTWRQNTPQDSVTEQLIHMLYKPVHMCLESPVQFDVVPYTDRIWPHRITPQNQFSQFYGIKRVQQLRQTQEAQQGYPYDVVIRARFDWFLDSINLEINPCVNVARTPTLDGHRFTYNQTQLVGINDQFAYGSSKVMDTYATIVDHIPDMYSNHGVDFCGELFLRANMHANHVCIKQHKWSHGIMRSWGIMP